MKNPTSKLATLRSKLEVSEATGLKGKLNQAGINMVDLMMWLVIAALLLAAALQGIGYYQQAAWTYQAKSDVAAVRTFVEAQYTLNDNEYPENDAINNATTGALATGDLKLSNGNTVVLDDTQRTQSNWVASLTAVSLAEEGKPSVFTFGGEDDEDTLNSDESSNSVVPTMAAAPVTE